MVLLQSNFAAQCRFIVTVVISATLCLLISTRLFAENWQDHATLEKAAREFVEQYFDDDHELQIKVGAVDDRLRLEACQVPLNAFSPYSRAPLGAVSIGVRCDMPTWKVHIPVQVQAYTNVIVAKQPITRGSLVTAADVNIQKREISRYNEGIYTDVEQLVGMVAKRNIRQDDVLTPRTLMPRRLVSRGQPVTIIAEFNGLQIRTKGEALMDGHQGQIIRVENRRSGKEIAGEVIAPSTVRVKM
jgi:flagellar basal body P-ring formation protein FlgA